jgi:hypothetical protein
MADRSDKSAIEDATEIIQRFGGIRPMANKLEIPVTTVQGWKKRNVIPGNRKKDVLTAAQNHGIDLSDFFGADVANENNTAQATKEPEMVVQRIENSGRWSSEEKIMSAIRRSERNAIGKSAWISVLIVIVSAVLGGAYLLWPSEEDMAQLKKIEDISKQAVTDINTLYDGQYFLMGLLPDDIQMTVEDLHVQADIVKNKVEQIAAKAEGIGKDITSGNTGALVERVARLEEQVAEFVPYESGISDLIERVAIMQQSLEGQAQLEQSLEELRSLVMSEIENNEIEKPVLAKITDLTDRGEEGAAALSQTLSGVSGSDMKAATMLLVLTKFRDSLNRSAPFEEDLQLLQKLVGDADPEVSQAIERLAPRAAEGVLTHQGLSEEFRGLAGDIIVASLKGEDVSVQEKAKARFNEILRVEKNGELITGTDTQATVVRAQKLLDEGNIRGAIKTLQSLEDSEASRAAQPWIDEAEFSLLAERLQQMIVDTVLSSASMQDGAEISPMYLDDISKGIRNNMPGGTIVSDPDSDFIMLPR